jgi:hypothetical protein
MSPHMGIDTETYWLTDRQSLCDFDFDFDLRPSQFCTGVCEERTWGEGTGIATVGAVTRKRLVPDLQY